MKIPQLTVKKYSESIAKKNSNKYNLKGADKINYGNPDFIFLKAINIFKLDQDNLDTIIEVPRLWKKIIQMTCDIGFNKSRDNLQNEKLKQQIRKQPV